jgi:hypothetical protein
MKNLNLCFAGLLCSAAGLMAAPCTSGSLQSYINLGTGGCGLGTIQFTNFTIAPGITGATAINPATINVTPGSGGPFNFTLMFSVNQTANTGDLLQALLRFTATGSALTTASIALSPSSAITGDGSITGILDVCPNAQFAGNSPSGCTTSPQSALAFLVSGDSGLFDSRSFAPSRSFDVFVDLTADGASSGTATLVSATVGLSDVPEPSALWLSGLGVGIVGFTHLRRRSLTRKGESN